MKVHFHQAVMLSGKNDKGEVVQKDYPVGIHEVPDMHLEAPYFHKLLKAKLVSDVSQVFYQAPESLDERNKRLAEKLSGKILKKDNDEAKAESEADFEKADESAEASDKDSEQQSEKDKQKRKSKHQR